MPIKAKNKLTERKLREYSKASETCQICGTPITPEKLGSYYCLNCNLKYANQIREREQKLRKELTMEGEIF